MDGGRRRLAWLARAELTDALVDTDAARETARVPVKRAIWHRTRGDKAEQHRRYALLKRNRWTEDPFLHRHMRKQRHGGRA